MECLARLIIPVVEPRGIPPYQAATGHGTTCSKEPEIRLVCVFVLRNPGYVFFCPAIVVWQLDPVGVVPNIDSLPSVQPIVI